MSNSKNMMMDLERMASSDRAAWLKANGNYIDFTDSYSYIEAAHRIISSSELNQISNSSAVYESIDLAGLKAILSNSHGDFSTFTYDYYSVISFNGSRQLQISMTDTFDSRRICYSIPLFRSIVAGFRLTDSSMFEFASVVIDGVAKIIFRIIDGNKYVYYNFSDEPR